MQEGIATTTMDSGFIHPDQPTIEALDVPEMSITTEDQNEQQQLGKTVAQGRMHSANW